VTANVIDVLEERGLLEAVTSPDIRKSVDGPVVAYAGFDPTSPSLQAGNLIAVLGLAHFQRCGHKVIAVVGGATGLIGDPSGKSSERDLLDSEEVERNLQGIRENLSRFLDFDDPAAPATIVNNNDWMRNFSFVDFIRDIGKHFRLGTMLNKESVRARLQGEDGMSFAEFSYQLLQSYDFLHLYDTENCTVQVGGSDQWGNITAGIDLIRRLRGTEAFGVTFPLVEDSSGQKFGKSEGNAVFLDQRKTSCYDFYQFFLRTTDADVVRFLKMFTFVPVSEIEELARATAEKPGERAAQNRLASELTRMVHGESGLAAAQQASNVLFGGSVEGLCADDLLRVFADVPSCELAMTEVVGTLVVDVAAKSGACSSKGEARRLIAGGGLYVNSVRVPNADAKIGSSDIVDGRALVLRSGRKTFHLVKIV
jgi:tyrosyl-tRNA synthetase